MRKLSLFLLVLIIGLGGVMVVNASRLTSRQAAPGPAPDVTIDQTTVVNHLAGAIRFRTITTDGEARTAPDTWPTFHAYLAGIFPLIEKNLQRETVENASLLYTWTGRRPDLAPVIMIGHMDVVPAADDTLSQWQHPPFDGVVADGTIWGRGSLDDKEAAVGLLEAVEAMLARGFTPERTIYIGLGHNEEAGAGSSGASAIAALLKSRGVHDAVLVDEGGWIFDKIPGVTQRVALVGTAEKGYTSVELTVNGTGGHSSMPPKETAVGILARAIDRAETHQMPSRLDGASAALFDTLAPEMSFGMKLIVANRWLTRPLLLSQLAKAPTTNASIRTTTAPTMLRASAKENVLASTAAAVINFRLLPGDTQDTVIAHLRDVIADPRVTIAAYHGHRGDEASGGSRTDGPEFAALAGAIRSVFPDVLVAPYLTVGATDARHYGAVAPNLFRFVPVDQPGSTELLHAPNEHIQIAAYMKVIRAYGAIVTALSK
ncbi:MAG: M20 family peptidase [Acidobacteriota bacterium]